MKLEEADDGIRSFIRSLEGASISALCPEDLRPFQEILGAAKANGVFDIRFISKVIAEKKEIGEIVIDLLSRPTMLVAKKGAESSIAPILLATSNSKGLLVYPRDMAPNPPEGAAMAISPVEITDEGLRVGDAFWFKFDEAMKAFPTCGKYEKDLEACQVLALYHWVAYHIDDDPKSFSVWVKGKRDLETRKKA